MVVSEDIRQYDDILPIIFKRGLVLKFNNYHEASEEAKGSIVVIHNDKKLLESKGYFINEYGKICFNVRLKAGDVLRIGQKRGNNRWSY